MGFLKPTPLKNHGVSSSVGMMIPNPILDGKIKLYKMHVPNHQSDLHIFQPHKSCINQAWSKRGRAHVRLRQDNLLKGLFAAVHLRRISWWFDGTGDVWGFIMVENGGKPQENHRKMVVKNGGKKWGLSNKIW